MEEAAASSFFAKKIKKILKNIISFGKSSILNMRGQLRTSNIAICEFRQQCRETLQGQTEIADILNTVLVAWSFTPLYSLYMHEFGSCM